MKNKWVNLDKFDMEHLSTQFQSAEPFNHIIIDNFFQEDKLYEVLYEMEVDNRDTWDKRAQENIQIKWRSDWKKDEDIPPTTFSLVQFLNSGNFLRWLNRLSGINGLIPDPYFTGGGFNQTNPGGLLAIHADGNWHDLMGVHRRMNVILYLNPGWDSSWGGNLELWSKTSDNLPDKCVKSISPLFNRLCIFRTDDFSFHGTPVPLACPSNCSRKSLILYYYTNTRPVEEIVSLDVKHRAIFYPKNI